VQFNEALIKYVNQSYYGLSRDASFLDAQNIELMAEIGVLRDGNTALGGRNFGLTRQQQNSVVRKRNNYDNYIAVETLSHTTRALKKTAIEYTTSLRGLKNNEQQKNIGLEVHPPVLTQQRNFETTTKMKQVARKKAMVQRRSMYNSAANTLEASRETLEATLRDLVIKNGRLRELNSEYLTHRLDAKRDRDQQKWNYIETLLQRNVADTYATSMKTQYEAKLVERDADQTNLETAVTAESDAFISLTDCEEENRHLEKHISQLTQRNHLLNNNCH